jgi:DNA adenine methylase
MAYLGGKAKGYQHIINILNNPCFDNYNYFEPFVGYAHILKRVVNKKSYIANDKNILVYTLLKCIQRINCDFPHITEEEYYDLKNDNSKRNLLKKAFAAFTYSYNGKEFGGYTNILHGRNYPNERKKYYETLRENTTFISTKLYNKSYSDFKPKNKLIYCDPPYENTTSYKGSDNFNHDKFWKTMRKWSVDNYVFISEYNAPDDFILIESKNKLTTISGTRKKRIEKLFVHESILDKPLYNTLFNSGNKSKKSKKSDKKRSDKKRSRKKSI